LNVPEKVKGIRPSKRTRTGLPQTMKLKKELEDRKVKQLGVNLWFSWILKQKRLGDYQLRK
jgi:hypothetical protein